jgi:hypothetical protein
LGARIAAELAAPQGEPHRFIAGLAGEFRMHRLAQFGFNASIRETVVTEASRHE